MQKIENARKRIRGKGLKEIKEPPEILDYFIISPVI